MENLLQLHNRFNRLKKLRWLCLLQADADAADYYLAEARKVALQIQTLQSKRIL